MRTFVMLCMMMFLIFASPFFVNSANGAHRSEFGQISWCGRYLVARTLNIEELTFFSGRIFIGMVVRSETRRDDEEGVTATFTTFEVLRSFKGAPNATITIKEFGDSRHLIYIYSEGEKLLLFFSPENEKGFTSHFCSGHSIFRFKTVLHDSFLWPSHVINLFKNRGLFYGFRVADELEEEFIHLVEKNMGGLITLDREQFRTYLETLFSNPAPSVPYPIFISLIELLLGQE